jgi:PAS domain S-box-containing protein
LLQKSLFQINELGREECEHKLRQLIPGQSNYFQCKHRLGDGQIRDVEVFSGPLLVQGKHVVYAIVHDITEKLQAEAKLCQALQETSSLVESISSILISLDREERVYRWNQAAASTFGLTKSEVQGRSIMDCPISWEKESISQGLQKCKQSREKVALEDFSYVPESRVTGFLSLSIQPILEQDSGELSGFLLLGTDTTEQKVMESQFLQAQKLEAIGQLAAGIAHEINTPVQYIESNTTYLSDSFSSILDFLSDCLRLVDQAQQGAVQSELLKKIQGARQELDMDFLREDIPESLQESLQGLKKVTRIVRSMKDFSHPGDSEKGQVDLNKALEDTLTISRNEWKYWAEVQTELDPELPLVPCLKDEINQVFLNIIINAAQALSEQQENRERQGKGKIFIGTRKNAQMAEVKIKDNGPGIPEKIRSRIFDPFFTTKAVGKGSGQGLYISYDIVVEKHKGRLFCESDTGSGTTFIIQLPLGEGGQ